MAKTIYAIEYLGAISIKSGTMYTTASILAKYPTATVLKLKTESGVKVSVNGTDMFTIVFDDETYLVTGHSYVFEKDCIVAIGRYVNIS